MIKRLTTQPPNNLTAFNIQYSISILLLVILLSCIAPRTLGLKERAIGFNRAIRWRSYEQASAFVLPERRAAFFEKFAEEEDSDINITNHKVLNITFNEEGKEAVVRVLFEYHLLPSITSKKIVVEEEWRLEDDRWYLISDFSLP